MLKIETSDFQNNIFRQDIAGDVIVGGYPINNIINNENNERKKLGGSNHIGTSRFDDLVIPIGLSVNSSLYGGCSQLSKIKTLNNIEIVNDKTFDMLFGNVRYNTAKNKTRKLKK